MKAILARGNQEEAKWGQISSIPLCPPRGIALAAEY